MEEGGAGGGIAFDSCYFSDWRGLAGKGTWHKGCAQQGWSVHVCVIAGLQLPALRWHWQCHELAGPGVWVQGRQESLECPKHLCSLACQTQGELCTLAGACARCNSIHPCPAGLHPRRVPWAVPAWVTILQWGTASKSCCD